MNRRTLVFFVAADPRTDLGPVMAAYHFATVAATSGLEAEVRLAGDAVKVALPDGIVRSSDGDRLRERVQAGTSIGYQVSF